LLFTWSAFFARGARLAFFTRRASRAFFGYDCSCGAGNDSRRCVQRFTQFAYALFTAFATRFAVFTRCAWGALFTRWTRCALFARCLSNNRSFFAGCTFFTWFASSTLFTWCALFAWLAFFVTTTVAVTALLAAVATLFVACRALRGGWLLYHGRSNRLFLGGEQAHQ
jgi:hypothetical protein